MKWNEIIMMIDEIMKDDRVELVRFETKAMGYDMMK